ncbi:hypothetical protein [Alteromonas lipolytica]|uniref:Uncharacterized protein n=1 Tax=Alteromonas lipolytica TaxID=1856405 RepID=A0A1E8FLE2_9ALTE|nr:hypothetical protein [Alteromonas lipolytica]OFI36253.1 hypothetical protein BFC17_09025 [Alteromonas lipolytica]GGF79154.1 hypothetical protein GCM10011338_34370 [Alteromonas lipolytica]
MKTYDITPNDWLKGLIVVLVLFTVFQTGALIGQGSAGLYTDHETIDQIRSRISLDLQFLDVGNHTLKTPPNHETLRHYISRINTILSDKNTGVKLLAIQSVTADSQALNENERIIKFTLHNSEQSVNVQLAAVPIYQFFALSPLALVASLLIAPLFVKAKLNPRVTKTPPSPVVIPEIKVTPKLTINLTEKTIGNGVNDVTVQLQNKPLCFYTALLHYCIENPDAALMHHKDIPPELTNLATKVFTRLMELGHTKRKRPDFNANLDKTLSEIRAALEEVFVGFSDEKIRYYPPRAQGEGSRSKQHSYALPVLSHDDVVIIGE